MPIPPSAYVDIPSLPFSYTITPTNFNAGTFGSDPEEILFRFVSPGNVIVGASTDSGGTCADFVHELYMNAGTVLTQHTGDRNPWWRYLNAGTFWVWCYRAAPGTISSNITFRFEQGPIASLPLPLGARIINDDSRIPGVTTPHAGDPFPATAYASDGTFLGFLPGWPAGETGAALDNGISLWANRFGTVGVDLFKIFDANQSLIVAFDTPVSIVDLPRIASDGTYFYIANPSPASRVVYRVTESGTVTHIATLPGGSIIGAIGVSRDGETLYWATFHITGTSIHAHDLVTDTALSDIYTVPDLDGTNGYLAMTAVNYNPGEILVLADDSLVTWYEVTGVKSVLIHVSPGGALIHSCEYLIGSGWQINHAYLGATEELVEVWFYRAGGADYTIGTLTLTTCGLSSSFAGRMYDQGVTEPGGTLDDELFGPSGSCLMLTLLESSSVSVDPPPIDTSTPCPCPGGPGGGLDTVPDPIGPLPPWVAMCEGGCGVDSVEDIAPGEVWL